MYGSLKDEKKIRDTSKLQFITVFFFFLGFLYFWAILVFSITTYVGIFKRENDCLKDSQYEKVSVFQNYKLLWDILKLLHMRVLIIAILTAKVNNKNISSS